MFETTERPGKDISRFITDETLHIHNPASVTLFYHRVNSTLARWNARLLLQMRSHYTGGGDFLQDHFHRTHSRRHLDIEREEKGNDISQGPRGRHVSDRMVGGDRHHSNGGNDGDEPDGMMDDADGDNTGIHGIVLADGSFYGLGPQDNPRHLSRPL